MLSRLHAKAQPITRSNFTLLMLFLLALFASMMAYHINNTYFHYPGNTYCSFHVFQVGSTLLLIYSGFFLFLGKHHSITLKAREICLFSSVMALVLLGCNAAQYTPFQPIDKHILTWGEWMHLDLADLVHWSRLHPKIYHAMAWMYDILNEQMAYFPLLLILLGRFQRVREHYFLLLFTALMGYLFYYFFPTTAPASMYQSVDFAETQRATGLKFYQIHHYIQPTTVEGGMVAFPSFHVIWAWLCAWLMRDWVWVFRALLIFNAGIVVSCVLLGWHYVLDVIASIALLAAAHYLKPYLFQSTTKDV